MILAHVLNALISQSLRETDLFHFLHFIEGFVAPAFMMAAGAAFTISIQKRKDDILYYRAPARKQTWRYLQIMILAYLLHIPFKTLEQCRTIMSNESYLNFIAFDVLQCIAIGLLLLQISFIIIRKEEPFLIYLLTVSILIILVTPFIYQYDFAKILPMEFATIFNKIHGSNFPAFPWIAYVFLGCYISDNLLNAFREGKEGLILKKYSIFGLIMMIIGAGLQLLSIPTTFYYDFWYTSPNIFMIRFGGVLISLYALWYAEKKWNYKMKVWGVFGRESLLVYIVHLLVVYGSALGFGLTYYLGTDLGFVEMFGVFFGVSFIMLILAFIWNWIKKEIPLYSKIVLSSIWIYFAYYFFTKSF